MFFSKKSLHDSFVSLFGFVMTNVKNILFFSRGSVRNPLRYNLVYPYDAVFDAVGSFICDFP